MSRCDIKKMPCSQQTECCRCRPLGEKKCCAPLNGKGAPSKELFPTAIREKRFPLVEGKKITREGGTIQFIFLCVPLATFSFFLLSCRPPSCRFCYRRILLMVVQKSDTWFRNNFLQLEFKEWLNWLWDKHGYRCSLFSEILVIC